MNNNNSLLALLLAAVALTGLAAFLFSQPATLQATDEQEISEDLKRYRAMAAELLENVSTYTGLEIKHNVEVKILTKAEVKEHMLAVLDEEYPGDEMERMSASLALLGLLPEDLDLRQLLTDLMAEQAGAFYDPRTKAFYAISDLPDIYKNPMIERTITAHELVHALQDQNADLLSLQRSVKNDGDQSYAVSALMEGQASVAMTGMMMNKRGSELPDLANMMRQSMSMMPEEQAMEVFNSAPEYVRETLISPYAEGSSFVQSWLKAHPEAEIADMFERLPISSEQVLNFDRYADNDRPMDLEPEGLVEAMPDGWDSYYSNVLGEFDLRILFGLYDALADTGLEAAKGWDGLEYAVWHNGDAFVVVGGSIWDSEVDAVEFAEAMNVVLKAVHGEEQVTLTQTGTRVQFIAGDIEGLDTRSLLAFLSTAPAAEM